MTTTLNFDDPTPPAELVKQWSGLAIDAAIYYAYTAGARHGWEQARKTQQLPEPITDRPPTEAAPPTDDWFFEFEKWLVAQMPAGTVIGDPRWWAPRIARACTSRFTAAPEAVGVADEELDSLILSAFDQWHESLSPFGAPRLERDKLRFIARAVLTRYGTAHPAPAPVGERPWERDGWCDDNGGFWAEHISRSDVSSWRYSTAADLGGWAIRCLPHWALPLPGDRP